MIKDLKMRWESVSKDADDVADHQDMHQLVIEEFQAITSEADTIKQGIQEREPQKSTEIIQEEENADPELEERTAWCRSVNIGDPNSETAIDLFKLRNDTIQTMIDKGILVGSVKERIPSQALSLTITDALRKGRFENVNIRKFVTDQRDKFRGR